MSYANLTDFIRPVGSVYFSSIKWDFDPNTLFGGNWSNSGTINRGGEIYNVWHRTSYGTQETTSNGTEEETSNG